jgi:uncharacterized protein (TIGR00251 family)
VLDDLYEIAPDGAAADGAADTPPDILLRVHVQPGAGRNAVMGRHGDALKVKVGAPPEGGRANAAVLALVATALGVPESRLSLESGEKSRAKRVRITGVEAEAVGRLLELAIESGNDRGRRGVGRHIP